MIIDRLGLATVGALFVLLGGCNFAGKDDVEKRAVERWNYLVARQAEKAYDYLSPGTRETQTRESYAASMNNRPVKWTAAKFNRKERCRSLQGVHRCELFCEPARRWRGRQADRSIQHAERDLGACKGWLVFSSQVIEFAARNRMGRRGLHAPFLCLNMAALLPSLTLPRWGSVCFGVRLAVKQKALWSN